jgi:cyclohexa-1,5-dienecarbonyl-CoA hydratase
MQTEFILTDKRDGLLTISLRRAPVNVLHVPMIDEILAVVEKAEADGEVRAVMITGHGLRVFSAGVEVLDHSRERIQETFDHFGRLLTRLQAYSLPTVAALNGPCIGGGVELALACDMIIATSSARIAQPEVNLASVAFPGILMLQHRIPPNLLIELMASGEPIQAADAHRIGLVNRIVEADDFEKSSREFMTQFTGKSRPVLQFLKRAIIEARGKTLESGLLKLSRMYVDELLILEDADEGIIAFAQRRTPVWKHR